MSCPPNAHGHLVILVPDREREFDYTTAVAKSSYARAGFAVAVPHRTSEDVRVDATAVGEIAREVLASSGCAIADGRVGVVGVGSGADVALASLRDAAAPAHVTRVVVLPRAVESADASTLVVDTPGRALSDLAATSVPTIAGVAGLAACDFRTSNDPCHRVAPDDPDRDNAQRMASNERERAVTARATAWLAFAMNGGPPPFDGRQASIETHAPNDFMPKTEKRPLLTVDALIGYTWRERDVPTTNGVTALMRVEIGASFRRAEGVSPSQTGYSFGGYGELGVTGDNDFLYGGGASATAYGGVFGVTASLGAYGRAASVNAGGITTGIFLGLRNLGMPDFGTWEPESPIGVRIDGRFGLDAHPERSISVMFEVAPLSLLMLGAGFAALGHLH